MHDELVGLGVRTPPPTRHWYVLRSERGPPRPPVEDFVAFVRSEEGRRAVKRAGRAGVPA